MTNSRFRYPVLTHLSRFPSMDIPQLPCMGRQEWFSPLCKQAFVSFLGVTTKVAQSLNIEPTDVESNFSTSREKNAYIHCR